MTLIILIAVCEFINTTFGMGFGTLLTPALILLGYSPLEIVPAILMTELLVGVVATSCHWKNGNIVFNKQNITTLALLSLASILGAFIGVPSALALPKAFLSKIIGGIIAFMGIVALLLSKRTLKYKPWGLFGLATIAAFNKTLTGGGHGPLLTGGQMLSGISGKAAGAITLFIKGVTGTIGVVLFYYMGNSLATTNFLLTMILTSLVTVPLAANFVRRVSDTRIKFGISILSIILGLFCILK